MTPEDALAIVSLAVEVFEDLDRRTGRPLEQRPDPRLASVRHRHLATTDPGGAFVAEEGGEIVGAAEAIVRGHLWGLSLLIVHPRAQGTGLGRELMGRSLEYGADTRGGLILASADPPALRTYARAGFELRPAMDATGSVRRPPAPARVRQVRWPEDAELIDSAGIAVRGVGHSRDLGAYIESGAEVFVHDGGGVAAARDGRVLLLAATEEAIAADLLRAVLNAIPPDGEASVEFITAGQDWAVEVVLDAGLQLRPGGAIFTRGDVGPLRPYLPSGSYL